MKTRLISTLIACCLLFFQTPVLFSQTLPGSSIGFTVGQTKLRGLDLFGSGVVGGVNVLTPVYKSPLYFNIRISGAYQSANYTGTPFNHLYALNLEPSLAYLKGINKDLAIRLDVGYSVQKLHAKSNFGLSTTFEYNNFRHGVLTRLGLVLFPSGRHNYIELSPLNLRFMDDGYIDNEITLTFGFPFK